MRWTAHCTLAIALALLLSACGHDSDSRQLDPRSNLIMVVIDTLRADRLGAYGYSRGTSPHFDALATEAVLFERAEAPAPWTLPSMVSTMTSTFPAEHGILVRGQRVAPERAPLAVRLRDAGYRTAAFVANPLAATGSGLDAGYERVERSRRTAPLEKISEWLATTGDDPFFLYVHTTEPHLPYAAPLGAFAQLGLEPPADRKALVGSLNGYRSLRRVGEHTELSDEQRFERMHEVLRTLRRRRTEVDAMYDASVAWADRNLGQLLSMLRAAGKLDSSVLIVLSDHGEELLEHGGLLHGQSLYAELTHVPLLWRLPGGARGGGRVATPVNLVDVLPTLMELLDLPARSDAPTRGASFADALLPDILCPDILCPNIVMADERRAEARVTGMRVEHEFVYPVDPPPDPPLDPAPAGPGPVSVSASDGTWKAIWNVVPDRIELYDTDRDPGEQDDYAEREPARTAQMRDLLEGWYRGHSEGLHGTPAKADDAHFDSVDVERLRALGYME